MKISLFVYLFLLSVVGSTFLFLKAFETVEKTGGKNLAKM